MNSHTDISEPSRHFKAVELFNRYFSISNAHHGIALLENLLSHFSRFPYENISKIIKYQRHFEGMEKIRLPWEIMEDHARHHLGGTCFSLTYFLQTILCRHGFLCCPVMADMRWGRNVHCALVVELDTKKYLVDPGYLLHRPMEIHPGKPRLYKTEFSGVELVFQTDSDQIELYTFDRHQKKWRYRFRNRPVPADIFINHWLSSFHWNSMHGLCLTKLEKDRMVYIHKTFMRETTFDQKINTNIKNNVHESIHRIFGIDPGLVEEALAAVKVNMEREREMGLWIPKSHRRNAE